MEGKYKYVKIFALAVFLVCAILNALNSTKRGMDSCSILLSNGSYRGYKEWQPTGCMMHNYTSTEAKNCLRYVSLKKGPIHFVFSGDSRMRQQYLTFIHHINPRDDAALSSWKGDNLRFINAKCGFKADFFWTPVSQDVLIVNLHTWKNNSHEPTFILTSNGVWGASSSDKNAFDFYTAQLERYVDSLNLLTGNKTAIMWKVVEPVFTDRLEIGGWMQSNRQYDIFNEVAAKIVSRSRSQFWSSSRLIVQGDILNTIDGLHLGPRALIYDTQILLNWFCNDHMDDFDGTCCSRKDVSFSFVQIVFFSVLGLSITLQWKRLKSSSGTMAYTYNRLSKHSELPPGQDPYILVTSLAKLSLIMAYFFLCDRTDFFGRENKHFSYSNFFLPLGCLLALGLVFTQQSKHSHVLNRDQTDEWKGWMILVILVYNMTDASHVVSIYQKIRVLMSAYIFLTGYYHMSHFWHTGDASVLRLMQVMFRLNFVAVLLCLCMDRPYHLYYFVPLISVCYLTRYILVVIPVHGVIATTKNTRFLCLWFLGNLFVLLSIITAVYHSRLFFDSTVVTLHLKTLFVTADGEDLEWWVQWNLHRYSIIYGMVISSALLSIKQCSFPSNHFVSNIAEFFALVAGFIVLRIYFLYPRECTSKDECNEILPRLVFLPIVAYILLRNSSQFLRSRYSYFFAWFGRIWLELLIGQYHIWLAADSQGVLILIPGYPVLNTVITTFIFVCVAHEMHEVTATVQHFAFRTTETCPEELNNIHCDDLLDTNL